MVTKETTKIQAHLVKFTFVRKAVSSQKRVSSGFTEQMVLEDILTRVLLKTKQQHSPKLVVDLYSQSVVYQRPRQVQNLLLVHLYSTEQQKNPSLLRLQKIQQHLHYLEKQLPSVYESSMDLELLLSATISRLLLESEILSLYLVLSLDLVLLQNQSLYHLLQVRFSQKLQVLQIQDTFKYSKTLFHLVHLQYLENLHIQISTTHQHTLVLEMLPSLVLQTSPERLHRLELVLQHFLDLQHSDLQQIQSKVQSSSIQRALLQLPNFIGYTLLLRLVLLQSLVLVLQNQSRLTDTTETTKIQAHLVDLHSPTHLLYTQTFVTFRQLVLELPSFTRQVEQLSNLSRRATTQLKDSSRDSQELKNLSLVQLTLVLVKLIPLVSLRPNTLSSRRVEHMLLLSNSINNWRSITI